VAALIVQRPAFASEAPLLKKLAERVQKDGQESAPDPLVDKFLELNGKKIKWCAPYDSERQIQLFRHADAKPERLVFILPEKPFPEFGTVWAYSVGLDGKLLKSGMSDKREAFKTLSDIKQAESGCRKEIEHWLDYFKIKKT
jgi:hypothetical protein